MSFLASGDIFFLSGGKRRDDSFSGKGRETQSHEPNPPDAQKKGDGVKRMYQLRKSLTFLLPLSLIRKKLRNSSLSANGAPRTHKESRKRIKNDTRH